MSFISREVQAYNTFPCFQRCYHMLSSISLEGVDSFIIFCAFFLVFSRLCYANCLIGKQNLRKLSITIPFINGKL